MKGSHDGRKNLLNSLSQDLALTLAGLSIAAIAFIVSTEFINLTPFSPIVLFFSISFLTLALSWNLLRFSNEDYHFVSYALADIGVLSLGCGFFALFYVITSWTSELRYPFGLFIIAFSIFGIKNLMCV